MTFAVAALGTASILCSLLEILYEADLENSSVTLIEFLQKADWKLFTYLFAFLEILTAAIFIYVSIIIYFCSNRNIGAMGVCIGLLCACLASFLKMCFAHPRPLWKYESIKALKCAYDFGYPSGHAFSSGGVIFYLSYRWIKLSNLTLQKLGLILFSIFIVSLDRTYLGVHFYFQVVAGFTYSGLVVSIIVHPKASQCISKIFSNLKLLVYTHLAGVLFMVFAVILYNTRNASISPVWNKIFEEKCKKSLSYDAAIWKNFEECSVVACVLGFSIGYHFSYNLPSVGLSKKSVFGSTFMLVFMAGVYFASETLTKYLFSSSVALFINFFQKYLASVAVSYLIPSVLQRISLRNIENSPILNSTELKNIINT